MIGNIVNKTSIEYITPLTKCSMINHVALSSTQGSYTNFTVNQGDLLVYVYENGSAYGISGNFMTKVSQNIITGSVADGYLQILEARYDGTIRFKCNKASSTGYVVQFRIEEDDS